MSAYIILQSANFCLVTHQSEYSNVKYQLTEHGPSHLKFYWYLVSQFGWLVAIETHIHIHSVVCFSNFVWLHW